ncbi:hypothetical protein IB267_32680 [Ensifer sp. ENS09]|uniref:hypothetical protein n=1 Tax=Ensifer sp. ENS09 TaxID=2769263 RepID=UPI00177E6338|nr:hypothetical protein [Ensifer sp. ENS09]
MSEEENSFGISRKYYSLLEETDIILPGSSTGKGFHFIRGWGAALLDRLVTHFEAAVSVNSNAKTRSRNVVISSELYDGEVAGFGGFDAVYRVELFGTQSVLRPDAALAGLKELVGRPENEDPRETIAVFQGFRSVKGGTPTLFRDRFIYPFVQYNRLVRASSVNKETQRAIDALVSFFDSLCIPVRVLDFGPWKNYAKRLLAVVSHSGTGAPTILAMFFVVGDVYREMAGIPASHEAFDIGITEKVLGFCVLLHRANDLQLPSSISPAQVVVHGDASGFGDLPYDNRIRIVFTNLPQEEALKVWVGRRGAPLFVTQGRRKRRVFSRSRQWEDFDESSDLSRLLRREDDALTQAAVSRMSNSASPPIFLNDSEKEDSSGGIEIVSYSSSLIGNRSTSLLRQRWPEGRAFY